MASARLSPFPIDLVFVYLALFAFWAVLHLPAGHPVRVMVAVAVLLLVPGYVVTTATFPSHTTSPTTASIFTRPGYGQWAVAALDGVERAALSFGISVLLLPLYGFTLAYLNYPYQSRYVFYLVTGLVTVVALVSLFRRLRLPSNVSYDLPIKRWVAWMRHGVSGRPLDTLLNVTLAFSILLASLTLVGAVAAPGSAYTYTDVSLLTVDDDGEYIAADFPTELKVGQPRNLALVIANHEGGPRKYTVVVQIQKLNRAGAVTETAELDRYSKRVADDGEWQLRHAVNPTMSGDRLRIVWLVYVGDVPEKPTIRSAHEYVYIWVEVKP